MKKFLLPSFGKSLLLLMCATSFGLSGNQKARAGEESSSPVPLADALEKLRARHGLPALAAAAVVGDRVVEAAAVGVRRIGSPDRVAMDDQWHIGSCSKAMTATVAAILVEQGTLRWETTVHEALPELRKEMAPGWQQVTIEQLLRHRAGAPEHPPADLWRQAWEQKGPPAEQRREFAKGLLRREPASAPGERFAYSNQGYAIAGAMMEQITGQSWEKLMRERLFEPLRMTSAGFGAPASSDRVGQPWGHTGVRKSLQAVEPGRAADNPPAIGPAGTVHCSIPDWAKFCAVHARAGNGDGPSLLKPESFLRLHQPSPGDNYAIGWEVLERRWAGGTVLTHSGSNTMWFATTWIVPGKATAFLVATNMAEGSAAKACDDAVALLIERTMGIRP
jgi:CubicO group peptidase (beta-lactamase class C family)